MMVRALMSNYLDIELNKEIILGNICRRPFDKNGDYFTRVSMAVERINIYHYGSIDTLNHEILLYKLKYHGISGVAFDWFNNYLTNRLIVWN